MKKTELKLYKDKSKVELAKDLVSLRGDIAKEQIERYVNNPKSSMNISAKKRSVAQLLTIMKTAK